MNMDNSQTQCSQCGSHDLTLGAHLAQTAEVGRIGLSYKDGRLFIGTEPLLVDVCMACGHIQRLYVKNPNHKWMI